MSNTNVITDQDFDRILDEVDQPWLVDFWAPWCAPCRTMGPVVEGLADAYAGRAVVAKLDVDQNPEAAGRLGVQSIPTLVLFQRGEAIARLVGLQPRHRLESLLDGALRSPTADEG